jgi:hypothetical protein
VHHIEPYHLNPGLELFSKNFIALCMGPNECHLRIGHGDDFDAFNPKVVEHANTALNDPQKRIAMELAAQLCRKY